MNHEAKHRFQQQQAEFQEQLERSVAYVREHAASSALIAFGLGFGLGVAIGSMLVQPAPRSRWDRMGATDLGRQIMDAVSKAVPDALSRS